MIPDTPLPIPARILSKLAWGLVPKYTLPELAKRLELDPYDLLEILLLAKQEGEERVKAKWPHEPSP